MGKGKRVGARFIRMTITVPENWKQKLDEFCAKHGYTKSEAIRTAIRMLISSEERGE
ncbi:MAG: ribbon-helix-helix domain-containing protein [Thermofilaceae archaeon]